MAISYKMKGVLVVLLMVTMGLAMVGYLLWPADEPLPTVNEAQLREWAIRLGVPGVERPEGMPISGPGSFNGTRELKHHLGVFPSVSGELDVRLAQEVLTMMERAPGLERYTITVDINTVRHALVADTKGNALIRMTTPKDESPTTIIYKGYLQSRLDEAAHGATLADTPEGRKPGKEMSF